MDDKKIGIASDHAGYQLKEFIIGYLDSKGYDVHDFGCHSEESCDYPDFGEAAARAVGEKSIEMIPQARLLPLTGYVHGGCSPVGMKKQFPTVLDESVEGLDTIVVSAGKIGAQVELAPAALCGLIRGKFAPVAK